MCTLKRLTEDGQIVRFQHLFAGLVALCRVARTTARRVAVEAQACEFVLSERTVPVPNEGDESDPAQPGRDAVRRQ